MPAWVWRDVRSVFCFFVCFCVALVGLTFLTPELLPPDSCWQLLTQQRVYVLRRHAHCRAREDST